MKYLLIIALISCTGTLVYSQSNKTSCDPGISNNVTCFQGGCSPQPCATLCGDAAAYDECVQSCTGGGCDKLACSSSIVNCTQSCTGGKCNTLHCDSKRCEQSCTGGECNMTCSSNAEECSQSCTGGNCQMICSPGVKQCNQICPFGNCVLQCDADKCSLTCPGGACTVIKSSTTPITTITTVAMTTTKSSGDGFKASVAWCLMFALFVMVENR